MPVDASPDMRPAPKGGGLVLSVRGGSFGELLVETYDRTKHSLTRNRYTSHFATCPNAAQHRSSR
jgi:hypothetical protein